MSAGNRRDRPTRVANAAARDVRRRPRRSRVRAKTRLVVDRLEAEPPQLGDAARRTRRAMNGLAGATTARRSPGRSARGLRIGQANRAISSAIA